MSLDSARDLRNMAAIMTLPKAGIDITSGHGADSAFSTGEQDPWANECLAALADVIINYDAVCYPLPSQRASQNLQSANVPQLFALGSKSGLLVPLTERTATDYPLTVELMEGEWGPFERWAERESGRLAQWRRIHATQQRIVDSHGLHVPQHIVEGVWAKVGWQQLSRRTGLGRDDLVYAFDVFVRTIQYHYVLGDRVYFAHPVREMALNALLSLHEQQERWSWGRYLVTAMRSKDALMDPNWFLDEVLRIRESVQVPPAQSGATWHDLVHLPLQEQRARILDVAVSLNLPARVAKSAQHALAIGMGVGSLLASPEYAVALLLGTGAVAAELVPPTIPGRRGALSLAKGILRWPGLFGAS